MILSFHLASRRAAAATIAGLALTAFAGCGSGGASSSSGDGLARYAPAGTPFYAEATLRPSGDLKTNLQSVTGKVAPGKDVGKLLEGLVGKASKGKLDYARDVQPWLGDQAAVAVTALPRGQGGSPDVAAIIDATDTGKAEDALGKVLTGSVDDRSYKGVDYRAGTDGTSGGIVDDELVVGTEPAFKAVVDASKGDGLDKDAGFGKARDAVADGALGFFYGDIRRAFDLAGTTARGATDAKQLEAVRGVLDRQGLTTVAVALGVTENAIRVRSAAETKGSGDAGKAADVVGGLPGGSFLALGLGDLGRQLSKALDGLRSFSSSSSPAGGKQDVDAGLRKLQREAGIDVQKDFLDWMGQSALFASGSSITDLGGALVVQSKDAAATKAALAKVKTLVAGGGLAPKDISGSGIDDGFSVTPAGAPVEVFAAQAGDRFVLAVNRSALDQALSPSAKLSDDDAFKTAADTLGDGLRPSFYLDFRKIAGLIGLAAGSQPGYAQVRPYLDAITTLVAGSKRDGSLSRSTLAIGVR